jgi:hypothetical protein
MEKVMSIDRFLFTMCPGHQRHAFQGNSILSAEDEQWVPPPRRLF